MSGTSEPGAYLTLKITTLGASSVGKSTFIKSFANKGYVSTTKATIGVEFESS